MKSIEDLLEKFIIYSRWMQAPVYLGLIIASLAYSVHFIIELVKMLAAFGTYNQTTFMLAILGLIDISMVINLLIVVIIGGYWTFVSKIEMAKDTDQLDYLGKITASSLKIKLIVSLVSISGVHLLETFINIKNFEIEQVIMKIAIHLVFIISALLLAWTDKLQDSKKSA
ncbi:MAG: TIGR00645 family protein [Bacteroidales bacterium]|nr:TIGR00645 family protein [Bacteroidales bacterium]